MVSVGPYNESTNFRHMFDLPDLRGPLPEKKLPENSLSGIIRSHPDFSKFRYLLKLANLEDIYADSQTTYTVFVPSDDALEKIMPDDVFLNMDIGTARNIVKNSTLERRIPSSILSDSPSSIFYTINKPTRIHVTNVKGRIYLNQAINVIHKDMTASNGIIHVIDDLMMHQDYQ